MVYLYRCEKCEIDFDIVKPVVDYDKEERCEKCGEIAVKQLPRKLYFSGTKAENAEYNPAFGKVIKNKRHRDYEAQKRGWVEVGNDYKSTDNLHKEFDQKREEKRKKSWSED